MTKPFSKDLYDTDDNAKDQVITYLAKNNIKAWVNPDQYGIDLLAKVNGEDRGYEVEVKNNWSGIRFPFSSIHIAGRKLKFAYSASRFFMLNKPRTWAILLKGQDVAESPIVKKDTIYTTGEDFIEVPIEKATFLKL